MGRCVNGVFLAISTTESKPKRALILAQFWGLTAGHRTTLGWGLLALAISSGCSLAYPKILQLYVDRVLVQKDGTAVVDLMGGLVALALLQSTFAAIRYKLFTWMGEKIVVELRERLFARLMSAPITFYDNSRVGDLMSRLGSDCGTIQNAVSVNISMVLRNVASAIGAVGLMLYISPLLGGLLLALLPVLGFSAMKLGKRVRTLSKSSQDRVADCANAAEEAMSQFRAVAVFNRAPYEVKKYTERLSEFLKLSRERINMIAWFFGGGSIVSYIGLLGVLWVGSEQVVQNQLTSGQLTSFLLYTVFAAVSFAALAGLWTDYMSASGAAQRVFNLLEDPALESSHSLNKRTGGSGSLNAKDATTSVEIELSDVSFSYPTRNDVQVLKCISLSVHRGKTTALVGPSGSGKTTLSSLVLGLYEPSAGKILWNGVDIREYSAEWIREQIGWVAQETLLFSGTILENIRYGRLTATEDEVRAAAEKAYATEFIDRFPDGFHTLIGERGIQLSGGQRQRISIARAILRNPSVLILDEATSHLDTDSEAHVRAALTRVADQRTSLVIAHRLSTVRAANQIVVMKDGQILEKGTFDELIHKPGSLFARLAQELIQDTEAPP